MLLFQFQSEATALLSGRCHAREFDPFSIRFIPNAVQGCREPSALKRADAQGVKRFDIEGAASAAAPDLYDRTPVDRCE